MSAEQLLKNRGTLRPAQLQELQDDIVRLQQEKNAILRQDEELRKYIREKTNQLLMVMGTLPLQPEELDDETLISMDPIGIVSASFEQVLEHLRKTNRDLSLAKEELQAIFDSAGTAILLVDADSKIQAYNQSSQNLFPDGRTSFLGQPCCHLVCHQKDPPDQCVFNKVIRSGTTVENSDFTVASRHYHVTGAPIQDSTGETTHVVLLYTDITEQKKHELALRETEERLDTILNSTQAGILLIDPETHKIVYANQMTKQISGLKHEELNGMVCHQFICTAEEGRCPVTDLDQKVDNSERVLLTTDGREIPILKTVTTVDIDGKEHLLENFIDISERKEAEEQLRKSEERYRTLYSNMQEGVALQRLLYDAQGRPCDYEITDINDSYEKILGLSRTQVIGRKGSDVYPLIDGKPAGLDRFIQINRSGKPEIFEFELADIKRTFKVSAAPLENDHFAIIFEDITQRKRDQEKIEQLAYFDSLTGLPNRVLMRDRLEQMLIRARRNNCETGIFFIDIDHFKRINDTLGHDKGDQLLKIIAERLSKTLRTCDSISRLGGDEFVILIDGIKDREDISLIAYKLLEVLAQPTVLDKKEVFTTTSIGVAISPEDGEDPDTLIKNADTAMYQAKENGRNTFCFYSAELNRESLNKLLLANQLRTALQKNQLFLSYQPQIDLSHGEMSGIEALLRWEHPDLGTIMPDQFIPLAEETGLILAIGRWVIEEACRYTCELQKQCAIPLRVSVNLSTKQFQDPELIPAISSALKNTGLNANFLELEITESILMENLEKAKNLLLEFQSLGVSLAIDDFGTGYSSLSYLGHLPINRLKIDKSFIQHIATHPDDAAITEAIIVMAHIIDIQVVAEGVEHKEELEFLRRKDCDSVQGYYFSRPLKPEQLRERILQATADQPFCFFQS